jgi:protein-disulfide isomerase
MEEKKSPPPLYSTTSLSISILLGALMISLAILLGTGVLQIEKGKILIRQANVLGTQNSAPTAFGSSPVPDVAPEDSGPVKVSVDDDPVLGSKNAQLTMIEFSDYECPFCKAYFDQTYSQLKKDYVDTGKLKIVFRDLPLPFHQNAHKEAVAANCAKEQGGDESYFKYHDELFKRTTSNGLGFALDKLTPLAGELGLNTTQFQQCLDSDKYKDEVDKDIADANSIGATGTPTFFIGKSTPNGTIEGMKIVGAQPYSAFQAQIDSLLK